MKEKLEPPREPVELLKQQADRLMEVARWDEAIYVLNEALAIAPDDSWVLMNLAVAHCESGRLRTAVAMSAQAVIADPSNPFAYATRSYVLRKNNRPDLACNSAKEATRLDPDNYDALDALFWAQIDLGRKFEARNVAYKMLELAPDNPGPHKNMAYVAICFEQWSDAERHSRKALELDPLAYDAMNNLGVALKQQGRLREATDCYLEAARLDPSKDLPRSNLMATADEYVKGPRAISKNASKIFDNPRLLILLFRLWLILAAVGGIGMKLFWNSVVQTINRTGPMIVPIAVVFIIGLTFLIAGFFASRQRRFESLPETVKTFVNSDQ